MDLSVVGLILAIIIALYFYNNPMNHGRRFIMRRFINWFPLGMSYAFLYMGRYNLNVAKNALGSLMSNADFGIIFAVGTWTYALSFLINGPLVDRIGGKRGILIASLGAAFANILLGVLTYYVVTNHLKIRLVLLFSVLYGLNMYFQSYGAVSIIKVKAYWFHVRERGVFGAIFGTLISFGVYFAFDWGAAVVELSKIESSSHSWARSLVQRLFSSSIYPVDATWAVFFIPAAIMIFWAVLDFLFIKDTPEEAGFPHLETHDASTGQMHVQFTMVDLLKRVFTSKLMLLLAAVELTAGVMRNGIMQWYPIFAKEVAQPGAEYFAKHWGLLLCIFGIIGGFGGGLMSDKFFQSRRGPPAALMAGFMFFMTVLIAVFLWKGPKVVGGAAVLISMAVIGVHSLMSGTAAADFGGRKATATSSGIVDGFVYLGSGLQSISIGFLQKQGWLWWPLFLMPFALLGCLLAIQIWHELPAATRKYIEENETPSALRPPTPST